MVNKYLEKIASFGPRDILNSVKKTSGILMGKNVAEAKAKAMKSGTILQKAKDRFNKRNQTLNDILKSKGNVNDVAHAENMYNSALGRASKVNKAFKSNLDKVQHEEHQTSKYRKNAAIGAGSAVAVGGLGYAKYRSTKNGPPKFSIS